MDASTVERIVRGVAADFGLPFELVSVVESGDLWKIIVRDTVRRRPCRFSIFDGPPAAMRRTVKDHLEALLES